MNGERRPELIRLPIEACEDAFSRAYLLEMANPGEFVNVDELTKAEFIRMRVSSRDYDLFLSRPTVEAEHARAALPAGEKKLFDIYDFHILKTSRRLYGESEEFNVIKENIFPTIDDELQPPLNDQEVSMLVAEITYGRVIGITSPLAT